MSKDYQTGWFYFLPDGTITETKPEYDYRFPPLTVLEVDLASGIIRLTNDRQ